MRKYFYSFHCFFLLVLLVTMISISCSTLYSQKINITQVRQEGNKIRLTFDLLDDEVGKVYDLTLQVSDDGGVTYNKIIPRNVDGDIKKVIPSIGKNIVWEMWKDTPELKSTNVVFHIRAVESNIERTTITTSKGISPWYWIGGGAVAVGGAATYFLLKKSNTQQVLTDLPGPESMSWPK